MDHLECANCGEQIKNDGPCPKCGSLERMILYDLLARPELLGDFSMSFISSVHLWYFLPAAIQSNLDVVKTSTHDKLIKGLCQQAINSTAELVEGIITDNIQEELESMIYIEATKQEYSKIIQGLDYSNWRKKNDLAKSILNWQLHNLECSNTVDLLFTLRDQLAHGRSYKLIDERYLIDKTLKRKGSINIESQKYFNIYKELKLKGFIPNNEDHECVSKELLLTPSVANGFFVESISFLRSFFKTIRLTSGYNMSYEFENSMKNQ